MFLAPNAPGMLTSTWSRYLAIAAASAAIMAAPALAAAQESASSDEEGSPSDPLKPEIESSGEDPFIDAVAEDAAESEQRGDGADAPKEYDLGKSSVTGIEREKGSSNATFEVELDQLSELPFKSAADVMQLAPGVLTTNHGGDGHAHETFMRGFYAGEGQDIEYMVDGVPLNEVSNPHGHGYTDLFFIPPMFIQTLSVTEGSFDPEQGDFAFAGSVNFKLGVPERGLRMGAGVGAL